MTVDYKMDASKAGGSSSDDGTPDSPSAPSAKPKSARGFASMDPAKQKEIARKGGRAAHEKGTAHEFTPDEARAAGRKGGEAVSRDRHHMAEIGREGGQARGQRVAQKKEERVRQTGEESTDSGLTDLSTDTTKRHSQAS
jgi:general stress protein YciG